MTRVGTLASDWNDLAQLDPLWAIASVPEKRHGRWDVSEFFASGEAEISELLEVGDRHELPVHRCSALDFGCGVGRLTRALATRFDECVGVDVSHEMVRRAEALNPEKPGLRFVVSHGDHLGDYHDGSFDLIVSMSVLQHLP